jgi:hypothetical protein
MEKVRRPDVEPGLDDAPSDHVETVQPSSAKRSYDCVCLAEGQDTVFPIEDDEVAINLDDETLAERLMIENDLASEIRMAGSTCNEAQKSSGEGK